MGTRDELSVTQRGAVIVRSPLLSYWPRTHSKLETELGGWGEQSDPWSQAVTEVRPPPGSRCSRLDWEAHKCGQCCFLAPFRLQALSLQFVLTRPLASGFLLSLTALLFTSLKKLFFTGTRRRACLSALGPAEPMLLWGKAYSCDSYTLLRSPSPCSHVCLYLHPEQKSNVLTTAPSCAKNCGHSGMLGNING